MTKKYKEYLEYIEKQRKKLTFHLEKDSKTSIALPNKFMSPTAKGGSFENDQFYWDSYFVILGLVESDETDLAKGMVENFAYLFNKYGIIPSRNKYYNLGISQPPFFTSMILEVFQKTKDENWLAEMADIAEQELEQYWKDRKHLTYKGLSKYCDHWYTHTTAEHESGWDMTSRFHEKCLNYLPVDLNSLLYKYEKDLSHTNDILENKEQSEKYEKDAKIRKETINKFMWNEQKGFYFDYNYKNKKQSNFYSLAGFYPMWANIASKEQAEKMKENLDVFECEGGLANTQKEGLSKEFKQWDYPNGWPNQQWVVVQGLLNYGYKKDAKRIMKKWIDMNKKVYNDTEVFWEKYNVVKLDKGKSGRYPTQKGFGWTDEIFVKMMKTLEKID